MNVRNYNSFHGLSPVVPEALAFFQERTGTAHAFQVVMDAEYGEYDCFAIHSPKVVSAKTFLSQLF